MDVTAAQLPPGGGDDAIVTTGQGVIMLDGASAFIPVPVPASVYAEQLAQQLAKVMDTRPEGDLRGILADAITATAHDLDLRPGKSPSSTVIIVRQTGSYADCLVLGDSLAILAGHPVTDDRLAEVGRQLREQYRGLLCEGHGYDQEHRRLLQELQREQAGTATGRAATGSPKPTPRQQTMLLSPGTRPTRCHGPCSPPTAPTRP